LTARSVASRLLFVDRPQTIIATTSQAAALAALVFLLLAAGGCFQSYADVDDDADARIEADGEVDADRCLGGWYDPSSGLCWEDPRLDYWFTWYEAADDCDALDLGGYGIGSWHLPTISELRSLVRGCPATATDGSCGVTDACRSGGSCFDAECHGCSPGGGPGSGGGYWPSGLGGAPGWYWSSSHADSPTDAWFISFYSGEVNYYAMEMTLGVRCVRPGP
jgi:hypothetical protein